jgi:hypothetical protein
VQGYQSATIPVEEVCNGKSTVTTNGCLIFKQCIRLNYINVVPKLSDFPPNMVTPTTCQHMSNLSWYSSKVSM